jgi:predicted O-methyltransferase YrrM
MEEYEVTERIKYIRKLYAPEDELLKSVDARIRNEDLPIHIGAEEGKLIQLFLKLNNAKKVVEIGTLAGYSTIWIARGLPSDGIVFTIEKDKTRANLAKVSFENCEVIDRIKLLKGDAREILELITTDGPFDAVFIDADKRSYPIYLDWAEKNVKKGGLIIADNTLLFEAVYQDTLPPKVRQSAADAMKEFNLRLADSEKYFGLLIPINKGISVAIKLF